MVMDIFCVATKTTMGFYCFHIGREFIGSVKLLKGYLGEMSQEAPLTKSRAAKRVKIQSSPMLHRAS